MDKFPGTPALDEAKKSLDACDAISAGQAGCTEAGMMFDRNCFIPEPGGALGLPPRGTWRQLQAGAPEPEGTRQGMTSADWMSEESPMIAMHCTECANGYEVDDDLAGLRALPGMRSLPACPQQGGRHRAASAASRPCPASKRSWSRKRRKGLSPRK